MKIIHYIPSIDRNDGGTAAYMQLLGNELGKLTEFHIITHASRNQLVITGCHIHNIASVMHYMKMRKQLTNLLLEINPDVCHINGCWYPGCAIVQKLVQKNGYKVVLSPHGMLAPWIMRRHYWTRKWPALQLYQKDAIKNADFIHVTAESEKDVLLRFGRNSRILVVANGVDVGAIKMKTSWHRTGKILFLSRIHPQKGIEFLIEALARVQGQFQCLIAGEGEKDYIASLKVLASRLGIADRVLFLGGIYGDKKWSCFQEADVFVLPTYSENFGIVVAESLAVGTPVITTIGAPWSELNTEHCGWWVEIGTEALVAALNEFLSLANDELEAMGRNGRKLVERKYSVGAIGADYLKFYNWILGKGEKPSFVYC